MQIILNNAIKETSALTLKSLQFHCQLLHGMTFYTHIKRLLKCMFNIKNKEFLSDMIKVAKELSTGGCSGY